MNNADYHAVVPNRQLEEYEPVSDTIEHLNVGPSGDRKEKTTTSEETRQACRLLVEWILATQLQTILDGENVHLTESD